MSAAAIVSLAVTLSLPILALSFLLTIYRVVIGPTLPDRVLALDMLSAIAIGFIAVVAVRTGFNLYIDIAIAIGLVGFLATVAFARFVLTHAVVEKARPRSTAPVPVRVKQRQKGKPAKGERQKKGKR